MISGSLRAFNRFHEAEDKLSLQSLHNSRPFLYWTYTILPNSRISISTNIFFYWEYCTHLDKVKRHRLLKSYHLVSSSTARCWARVILTVLPCPSSCLHTLIYCEQLQFKWNWNTYTSANECQFLVELMGKPIILIMFWRKTF